MESSTQQADAAALAAVMALGLGKNPINAELVNAYSRLSDGAARQPDGEDVVPEVPGYELAGRLGQGGMGTVWRATQFGTHRQVAIKLMGAASLGSDRARQRFEREVELAARLEHPSIVRLYDSGSHGGICHYAMELIDGPNLDRYVEDNQLAPRQILALMRDVCLAVQYANQRGVIHRDLKPSNILVTIEGGSPTPHVVDFGLAKALNDDGISPTLTRDGQYAGTPAFMSPEQASGRWDGIDTRTDVYGLGATLYLLLAGQPPHDQQGPRYEVLRRVANDEVRRPRQLNKQLDAELEALLLKALNRDPEDRYASAGELAQDIERYLKGDPLQAAPLSARARLLKFVRKHRVPLGVAAAVVLVLAAATLISTWQAVRATRARNNEAEQRKLAQQAAAREAAQRQQAEAEALLLESFFQALDPDAEQKGDPDLRTRLVARLDQAAMSLDKDAGDSLGRARLRNALGETQLHLGEAGEAERLFQAAADERREHAGPDDPKTLLALNNLARAYDGIGRYEAAIHLLEKVRDQRIRILGPDHADTLRTLHDLAKAYHDAGRYAEMIKLLEHVRDEQTRTLGPDHRDTLEALTDLADGYRHAGRNSESIALLERVRLRQIATLGPDHPDTLATLGLLALAYDSTRRTADAIQLYEDVRDRQIKKLGPDHPETLVTLHNLAGAYDSAGRTADAIKLYENVRDRQIKKLGPDHPDTLSTFHDLAGAYDAAGRAADAIKLYEDVRDRQIKKLGPDHLGTLATTVHLAAAYKWAGRTGEAVQLLEDVRGRMAREFGPEDRQTLIVSSNLADAYITADRFADAIRLLEQTRDKQIKVSGPDELDTLETSATLARAYKSVGRFAEAIGLYEHVRDQLVKTLGPDHAATLAIQNSLAVAYGAAGRTADAIKLYEGLRDRSNKTRGLDHPDTLAGMTNLLGSYLDAGRTADANKLIDQVRGWPTGKLAVNGRGDVLFDLATDCRRAGRISEEVRLLEQLRDLQAKTLVVGHPDLLKTLDRLARAYQSVGRESEAIDLLVQVREQRIATFGPDQMHVYSNQFNLAFEYQTQGQYAKAEPLWRELAEWCVVHPEGNSRIRLLSSEVLANLIACYRGMDRMEEAERWAQKLRPLFKASYAKAIRGKTEALTTRPSDPALLADRGDWHARAGHFQEAVDDFSKAITLGPEDHQRWHHGVPLLLQLGDVEGYRRRRSEEIERFKASTGVAAHRVVKDILMLPLRDEELKAAEDLASRALASEPTNAWFQSTKGMAEYRSGHFEQAIPLLIEAGHSRNLYCQTESLLFGAMVYERLGRHGEARQSLAAAVQAMETKFPRPGEDLTAMAQDWVICRVARQEAEGMIGRVAAATQPDIQTGKSRY